MVFLQTPNISSPGLLSIFKRPSIENVIISIGQMFGRVMPQLYDTNVEFHIAL